MSKLDNGSVASKPGELKMWLPVDAIIVNGRPAIEWLDSRGLELEEPFFHETVARVKAREARETIVTELEALLQLEQVSDSVVPSGFIFHSSRCGSTVLANACRALNGSIVIAEAPVVDKIVSRFFTDAAAGSSKELLYMVLVRATISALGQRLRGDESRYFVKFSCTSTLQMSRLRTIWPNVPFVFMYRDPVEIIVSNLRTIPEWMQPQSNPGTAAAIVGVDAAQLDSLSPEEFCARALGRFFSEVSNSCDSKTSLLNYSHLSLETILAVLRVFEIEPSLSEVAAIREAARLYSKGLTRRHVFDSDSKTKRDAASEHLLAMSERWAQRSYQELETRARAGSTS